MGKLIGESNVSKKSIGYTISLANFILFLLAYTFGKTWPNNKIKKAAINTSRINFKSGTVTAEKIVFPTTENKSIMEILMKLFATRSVATNFLGFAKSSEIIFPLELFSCTISSMSFCDNENKATSAPEINAEQNSKMVIPTKPNTTLASIAYEKNKLGSGSKLVKIN